MEATEIGRSGLTRLDTYQTHLKHLGAHHTVNRVQLLPVPPATILPKVVVRLRRRPRWCVWWARLVGAKKTNAWSTLV